ncbi:hypothetical protein DCC81_03490 [Chitinophaga parva]|uniref:TolB-like 6-blade propeller-like n=1 Tax=Chitinophaga parva TaxID=2169414 RepID=A0A2T7BLJ4_9BACT|nr:hypothetical protein [Chitinophaga parva]PUZ28557.1 hypothetical protein DCC81_03490 [Chitinophaga parva]
MKTVLRIGITTIIAVGIVCFLQLYAKYREGQPTGFNRRMVMGVLHDPNHIDLNSSSLYIISLDDNRIVLGDTKKSGLMLTTDFTLKNCDTSLLDLPDSVNFAWGAARIVEKGKQTLLVEGITPNIYAFIGAGSLRPTSMPDGIPSFDLLAPSDSGFGFRAVDTVSNQYVLGSFVPGEKLTVDNSILTGQQDVFFSADGSLLYDPASRRFIYVYYYRNGLIGFNQGLDTVYYGTTIDTVTFAKISMHRISSERKVTFSSPPTRINKHACVSDGWLFIYSSRRADNEKGKLAFTSSVIDVYSVSGFHYLGSFYVPDYDGKGIRDFAVYSNHLVALRGDELFVFSFDRIRFLKQ